jgi:ParB family chromosome partitioning protein
MTDRRLGRGLEGLIRAVNRQPLAELEATHGPVASVPIGLLDPNPNQPRQGMKPEELDHLKASIIEHGVLQPIIVRRHGDRFQVIAGERRFRAAQGAGLADVPVVVRDATDDEMLELALVENLQREDLDPIEKAMSFKAYLARSGKTQEIAATRLGLDRSTIANMIRLLDLPDEVKAMVRSGLVLMGHARAILSLGTATRQVEVAERVAREGLSVRQVERLVAGPAWRGHKATPRPKGVHARDLEGRLREALGTKVSVEEGTAPGTGKIVIEFYSNEDLERILGRLM